MNKREKMVQRVVKKAADFVIGGHENAITDGDADKMPAHKDLAHEIYREVIETKYLEFGAGMVPVKKDIRFIGKAKIYEMIDQTLDQENL